MGRALRRLRPRARPTAGEDDTPAELAGSWRALASTHGRLSIGALAREVGYSRQHLARRFRDEFGLGPKLAGRILRFQRANRLLRAAPSSVSLAEMAAACGYTDEDYGSRGFSVRDPEGNPCGASAPTRARAGPD